MHKNRLLRLADLLESDAKNKKGVKFNLGTWGGTANGDCDVSPPKTLALNCGTTACAVGVACLSGVFKSEGFRWRPEHRENNIVPLFKGKKNWDAVEAFFEIGFGEACNLFADTRYPEAHRTGAKGERAVAKRIRKFVSGEPSHTE